MSIAARSLHGIGVCVIPSPYNDHRPFALRHRPLAFVSAFLVLMKLAAIGVIGLTPAPAELSTITVDRIVQLTNAERTKAGLKPLAVNTKLAAAAKNKGNHMLKEDYFAHISPSGVTPWFWMAQQNYNYQVAGENLAIDFVEAEDVVAAWIASPSHKANMLHKDYTETGIGVVSGEFQGGTSVIVVHMFGKPSGAQVAAEIIKTTPTPIGSPQPAAEAATPVPAAAATPVSTPTPLGSPKPLAEAASPLPSPSPSPSPTPSPTPLPPEPEPEPPQILAFIISPLFDSGNAAAILPDGPASTLTVHQANLAPQFATDDTPDQLRAPSNMARLSRRMAASVAATVIVLLIIAVFVRIRVQRPALITHATAVAALALALFVF